MDASLGSFIEILKQLDASSTAFIPRLVPDGKLLIGALLSSCILWELSMWLLGQNFVNVSIAIYRHVIISSMLLVALNNWSGSGLTAEGLVKAMPNYVASKLVGSPTNKDGLQYIFDSVKLLVTDPEYFTCSVDGGGRINCTEKDKNTFSKFSEAARSIGDWTVSIIDFFGSFFFKIAQAFLICAAVVLLIILAAIYFLMVHVATYFLNLSLAFAPIMIPFILIPYLDKFFTSAIDLVLGYTAVPMLATIVMASVFDIIVRIRTYTQDLVSNYSSALSYIDLYSMQVILLACTLAIFLMLEVPGIAAGMVGGRASMGGGATMKLARLIKK